MLKLYFLNVADGDAALIQLMTPEGPFRILVDAGRQYLQPYPGSLRRTAGQHLEAMGISHLDAVVVTHLHEDHFAGLADIIPRVSIDHVYAGYFPEDPPRELTAAPDAPKTIHGLVQCLNQWSEIVHDLRAAGTVLHSVEASATIPAPGGLRMALVCPDPDAAVRQCRIWQAMNRGEAVPEQTQYWSAKWRNPGSLRLELEYAGRRVILAADCYGQLWQDLPLEPCDILKVPHHGDIKALTETLVNKLRPAHGIISCSAAYMPQKDRPSQDTISMLRQAGCRVWFTDSFCAPCQQAAHWDSVDFQIWEDGTIQPPKQEVLEGYYDYNRSI